MRPSPLPLYLSRTRRICAQFLRSGQTETNASRRMSLQDEETVDLPATLHCEKSAKPFRVTSLRLCLSLSLSFSQCIRLSFNGLLSATRPHCAGQILSSATELHQIRTGSSLSRPALYLSPPSLFSVLSSHSSRVLRKKFRWNFVWEIWKSHQLTVLIALTVWSCLSCVLFLTLQLKERQAYPEKERGRAWGGTEYALNT